MSAVLFKDIIVKQVKYWSKMSYCIYTDIYRNNLLQDAFVIPALKAITHTETVHIRL